MKNILIYVCGFVLLLLFSSACDQASEKNGISSKDQRIPAKVGPESKIVHFALPSAMDGNIIDSNEYQGKVRLINFFATWCPPCLEEIPTLIELHKKYDADGFSVIGLSVDQGGREIVKKFAKKLKINYPVLMADDDVTNGFGGISGIPVSFLVGRDDVFIRRYFGYVDHDTLKNDIKEALIKK